MKIHSHRHLVAQISFALFLMDAFGFALLHAQNQASLKLTGQGYVDCPPLELNNDEFTISFWILTNEPTENIVLSNLDESSQQGFEIKISVDQRIIFRNDRTLTTIISNTRLPKSEWHHVAFTFNNKKLKLYIDGVLDKEGSMEEIKNSSNNFLIGSNNSKSEFFNGSIDELLIWKTALNLKDIRYSMNQELLISEIRIDGREIPATAENSYYKDVQPSQLTRYYSMNDLAQNFITDRSENQFNGALKNNVALSEDAAPLPYRSVNAGNWNDLITWSENQNQTSPGDHSIVDQNQTIDWNIVETNHDIQIADRLEPLALSSLKVNSNEIEIIGNLKSTQTSSLIISDHLKIDGGINLKNSAQLFQPAHSYLEPSSTGSIQIEQQGFADNYTYSYWSSPVGRINELDNNQAIKIKDILFAENSHIEFVSNSYDGSNGLPLKIADHWIWKYGCESEENYSTWKHIRKSGKLNVGEGFTMKGPGSEENKTQLYQFKGKPNNGNIDISVLANNQFFVGNPYPSSLDLDLFILDNQQTISGTIYFQEHYANGSHIKGDFDGGFAAYNFSGSVSAPRINTIDQENMIGHKPSRYADVAKGFFIESLQTGVVSFKNSQRTIPEFQTDHQNMDKRMTLRLGFDSVNNIHRQLLFTLDETTTLQYDWGYDGKLNDDIIDDLYWILEDQPLIIQASNDIQPETLYQLGLKVSKQGNNSITIDGFKNASEEIIVYIHDSETEILHNLTESDYQFHSEAGIFNDRFSISFNNHSALSLPDNESEKLNIFYSNSKNAIVIYNPEHISIEELNLLNVLGQSILKYKKFSESDNSEIQVKHLNTGAYIIKLDTASGSLSKKVLIK